MFYDIIPNYALQTPNNKEQIEKSVSYGVLSSLECSPKRCIPPELKIVRYLKCIIRDNDFAEKIQSAAYDKPRSRKILRLAPACRQAGPGLFERNHVSGFFAV